MLEIKKWKRIDIVYTILSMAISIVVVNVVLIHQDGLFSKTIIFIILSVLIYFLFKYIQDYNCPNINYESVLKNNKIFENSLILDSTQYLTNNAEIFLNSNKFIYEKEDTHLNELGLNILSKFLLKNINS